MYRPAACRYSGGRVENRASALRGSKHMEGVRTWKSGSRLSATLGERTSTLRLCTLAETPPTGHGRCARRQHISRLQKKEQEDGKQRGGSAPGTTRADGTLRRGFSDPHSGGAPGWAARHRRR